MSLLKTDTAFMELSRDLSDVDRTDLLKKINESLNINEEKDTGIYEKEIDKDEKTALLHEEINQLPLLIRLFLWIKSKLTGKSERDLHLAGKISKLKRKIRHQSAHLTGFETRNLTPNFAEHVFKLYSHSLPLRILFRKLWMEPAILKPFFLML